MPAAAGGAARHPRLAGGAAGQADHAVALVEYAVSALFGVLTFLIWPVGRLADGRGADAFARAADPARPGWRSSRSPRCVVFQIWRALYYVPKPKPQPGVYGQPQPGWPQQHGRPTRPRASPAAGRSPAAGPHPASRRGYPQAGQPAGHPQAGQYGQPSPPFRPPQSAAAVPQPRAAPQSAAAVRAAVRRRRSPRRRRARPAQSAPPSPPRRRSGSRRRPTATQADPAPVGRPDRGHPRRGRPGPSDRARRPTRRADPAGRADRRVTPPDRPAATDPPHRDPTTGTASRAGSPAPARARAAVVGCGRGRPTRRRGAVPHGAGWAGRGRRRAAHRLSGWLIAPTPARARRACGGRCAGPRTGGRWTSTRRPRCSPPAATRSTSCSRLAGGVRDAGLRDAGRPGVVTYSKKVFIPLTRLCRDRCHYCTFATVPHRLPAPFLERDEVLAIARAGRRAGLQGGAVHPRRPARGALAGRPGSGWTSAATTPPWTTCGPARSRCWRRPACCRTSTPACCRWAELQRLKPVAPSMGMMLETTATRLWSEPGGPHYGSPDKEPAVRLRVLEDAGRVGVPFTTGILIGIGETLGRAGRVALRDPPRRAGSTATSRR